MEPKPIGKLGQLQARVEMFIMTRLVPMNSAGPVFGWIFKIPILFYRAGLGNLVGEHILLLTTTGRKSGKLHATPLEYSVEMGSGDLIVCAGWGGKTDWYRNACANPRVGVQLGRVKENMTAMPMSDAEIGDYLAEISGRAPVMMQVWQRWCDRPIDGSAEAFLYAARFFPALRLKR